MIPRGSACLFTAPELRNPWTPAWHHRLELKIPVLNWDPRLATLVLGSEDEAAQRLCHCPVSVQPGKKRSKWLKNKRLKSS